jgi:class 3 adenylate cyclase
MARAALGYGGRAAFETGVVNLGLISRLERALDATSGVSSALAARLMARLAEALTFAGESERKEHLVEAALQMARDLDDPVVLGYVLGRALWACWGPGNAPERLVMANEMLELARASGDVLLELEGSAWQVQARMDLAEDPAAVTSDAGFARERADRLRQPYYMWIWRAWRAMEALATGQLEQSEELARDALLVGQSNENANAVGLFGIHLMLVRREQGRMEEIRPMAIALVNQYLDAAPPGAPLAPQNVGFRLALAHVDLESGFLDEARKHFRFVIAAWDGRHDLFWLSNLMLQAHLAYALDERGETPTLYERLAPYADRVVTIAPGTGPLGSVSFCLGLLATALGRWNAAENHYQAAIATNDRLNLRVWVAWSRHHYAKMLLARDAPSDRERALELMGQALDAAQEMGMKKLVNEGLELKLRAQGIVSSDMKTSIDAVAATVRAERTSLPPEVMAPDGTVTIMFSDIEGSTELTVRLGDARWQELLRQHNALIRKQIRGHGGFEVKTMGDGFMVVFRSALRGLECAVAIQRAFSLTNPSREEPVRVRIGLHTGEALKEDGDFFGQNVILASRVAGQAAGDEILVSSLLKQLVEGSINTIVLREPRYVELKGFTVLQTVYPVDWRAPLSDASVLTKPVVVSEDARRDESDA